MAFFNLGKKEKKESLPPPGAPSGPPSETPIDKISDLKERGLSDRQVVDELQSQGYSPTQTFNAMTQSEMQSAADLTEPEPISSFPEQTGVYEGTSENQIEEIAEAIIEEKWNELIKNVNKIIEWKERTETKISQLEQKFKDLKSDFDNLHSAVLGKVGEYDQNLTNIGAEIKAMEKVFQKLLPTFTENVSELSRLSRDMKKAASKK